MIARFFAYFFSIVFHPLLLPTYSFAIIIFAMPHDFGTFSQDEKLFLLFRILIFTFAFPVFAVFMMYLLRFVKSLHLETRHERILPYIATGIFYLGIWYQIYQNDHIFPTTMSTVLLGATIAVFLSFFLNVTTLKISMHTVGMGCLLGVIALLLPFAYYNLFWPFVIAVFIAGLVGTSRMFLTNHDNQEIYGGYVIGCFCQFLAFYILGF
jgi:hypothetical protein